MILQIGKILGPIIMKMIVLTRNLKCERTPLFTNLDFYINKIEKVYFRSSDCSEGDPRSTEREPCETPKGPCVPLKKPGYPTKPEVPQEPFCVECPPKKPCSLNQCPTLEGTSKPAFRKILSLLYFQSQRNDRLEETDIRDNEISTCQNVVQRFKAHKESRKLCFLLKKPHKKTDGKTKISQDENKNTSQVQGEVESAIMKMVCQQFLLIPEPEKMSESLTPPKLKSSKNNNLRSAPALKCSGRTEDLLKSFAEFFQKRNMSSDARSFSNDFDSFKGTKCKTVIEMCARRSLTDKISESSECLHSQRTSCHPERNQCPRARKITESASIDRSISSDRKIFEKNDEDMMAKNVKLPRSPSQPVILHSCPPPPKLQPGFCPCADVFMTTRNETKLIVPSQSCPLQVKYSCPESRIYYCPSKFWRSKC
ncbi:uncharacterized protein LOC122857542 isoform X2 [Aphidius gifuensis]|uniref:uncharacterized protein LOC122857542 isoform X2 n=1 Tax=Aphidius gifuensis TaxID=684658 RepID=UPI001CDC407A|nr:uncharacterized protein LOC122857542 isoform X2 [Aphidius gifuensis]